MRSSITPTRTTWARTRVTASRVVVGESYECNWTTILAGGQITVKVPFLDAGDSTLAVTGGTGRYRDAGGVMKLHSLENGTKFAFEFHLVG